MTIWDSEPIPGGHDVTDGPNDKSGIGSYIVFAAAQKQTLDAVRAFVEAFRSVPDLQFERLPYAPDTHEGVAYLLMVAAINQNTSAEHVRDLMYGLHEALGPDIFRFDDLQPSDWEPILRPLLPPSWKLSASVPAILKSAAKFIRTSERHGGLVVRGRAQPSVLTAAEKLAGNIYYMGKNPMGARKKLWMFLRWMVRPAPDLQVWSPPLNPAELRLPLDVNTAKAVMDLATHSALREPVLREGLTLEMDETGRPASTAANVERATAMARWFFPDDPAIVDYAFFCYGRRFSRGADAHRCWKIISCQSCPLREHVGCPGAVSDQ